MLLLSSVIASALNRALADELIKFGGRHIAFVTGTGAGARRLVWRIDGASGRLRAANPLIDADCLIRWKNGGVHISGDGDLFRVLSEVRQKTDWLALVSGLLGESFAPHILGRLEQGADVLQRTAERHLVLPQEAADYFTALQATHERMLQLARRIDTLAADINRG